MRAIGKGIIAVCLGAIILAPVQAQEIDNDYQSRYSAELSYDPINNLRINISPEFRLDESFSLDRLMLDGEIVYSPFKFVSLGASYRFIANLRNNNTTEYYNKYAFKAKFKTDLYNFEPVIQIKYSNYADDDVFDKNFMRYKALLKYDIPKCKLTPLVSAEAFQQVDDGKLYKMRYSTGFDYKLFKRNYLGVRYKFDFYTLEYRNKHIVDLSYKIKF